MAIIEQNAQFYVAAAIQKGNTSLSEQSHSQDSYSSALALFLRLPLISSSGESAGSVSRVLLTPYTHHQPWLLSSLQLNYLKLSGQKGESTLTGWKLARFKILHSDPN